MSKINQNYKKIKTRVLLAIFGVLIFSMFYIFLYGNVLGIEISCKDYKALGIKRVPPPLMTALPPPTECIVDLKVEGVNGEICSYNGYEVRLGDNVISCKKLDKEIKVSDITVIATFYTTEGDMIKQDTMKFNKKGT